MPNAPHAPHAPDAPVAATTTDGATFSCPRCEAEVTQRFWGPCQACRDELNRTLRGEAREQDHEATRFEPSMNVVPNHVATKD